MTKKHLEILAKYGLKNVPPEECILYSYKAGEAVISEGMPIARLFIAVKGRAKAGRISGDGKRLVICRYISGGMMGEVELLTGRKTANTSITAITDFEAVSVSYKYCLKELRQNVAFSNIIGKVLAEKLAGCDNNYASSALYSGKQRLCSYILENSNCGVFDEVLTEVSASVAMSYRHMLRLFNELCENGILKKLPKGYLITDEAALARFSGKE